jgi:hypothetical protein
MYDVGAVSGRVILHGAFETYPLTFFRNVVRENDQYVAGGFVWSSWARPGEQTARDKGKQTYAV